MQQHVDVLVSYGSGSRSSRVFMPGGLPRRASNKCSYRDEAKACCTDPVVSVRSKASSVNCIAEASKLLPATSGKAAVAALSNDQRTKERCDEHQPTWTSSILNVFDRAARAVKNAGIAHFDLHESKAPDGRAVLQRPSDWSSTRPREPQNVAHADCLQETTATCRGKKRESNTRPEAFRWHTIH